MKWTLVKKDELTEEEIEKIKTLRKYPKIDTTLFTERDISKYKKIEKPFIGLPLWIELKRDGSNLRLFYLGNDRYALLSRNQYAVSHFIDTVREILTVHPLECDALLNYVKDNPCLIFLELFGEENSPSGFDNDIEPSLEVIDIHDLTSESGSWMDRQSFAKQLPVVPCLTSNLIVQNKEEYEAKVRTYIDYCNKEGREGIVIKATHPVLGRIMAKEKVEKALKRTGKKPVSKGIALPLLEDSEIMGAISKAHAEIGESIWDKKVALPLVAKYIREEGKKHERYVPRNIYRFYLTYLDNISKKVIKT